MSSLTCSSCGTEVEMGDEGPLFDDDAIVTDGVLVCGDCLREDGELDEDDDALGELG